MRTEPAELSRNLISATVAGRWDLVPIAVEYLPVGGGGHHWLVTCEDSGRWFVTANGLVDRGHWLEPDADAVFARTLLAYETVRNLGLRFALSAVPDRTGSVLYRIGPDWALSIYPYLDKGAADEDSRRVVAGYIGQLHALAAPVDAPRWRSDLPQRRHLEQAIAEREGADLWGPGPYAERSRSLLIDRHGMLIDLLEQYDGLVTATNRTPAHYVLTHGEPHPGNTMHTVDGATLLIDWDTLAFAPPERDLWQLLDPSDGAIWAAYTTAAGRPLDCPRREYMELFPLWWRLAEIGSYVRRFRAPHSDDADAAAGWQELQAATTFFAIG